MVHVTNWQLLHSVWVVWFWIMPFGVWCEQASPFIHAGFFHLIWLWNVTWECDLGMWPGNETWECDLGMRPGMWPGNETWEWDLGMWSGNLKGLPFQKSHLNPRPYLYWEGLGMRLGAHGTWVLAGPSAAVVVGGCCQERGWSRHLGCCQTLSGTPEQETNVRDNMDQTQPDSHHISMRVNTQFPLPSFSRG